MHVLSEDYRPNREALSNAEIRATGLLGQGAVLAYRPKPKSKAQKKRKRKEAKHAKTA